MRKVVIVSVGTDDIPAGPEDMKNIKAQLTNKEDDIVFHIPLQYQEYILEDNQRLILSLGTPSRPAGETAANELGTLLKQQKKDEKLLIVTAHHVSVHIVQK